MNIATLIAEKARLHPNKRAVVKALRVGESYQYPHYTFAQFETRSNQLAQRLLRSGIGPGTRTLVFVRPSLDFSVIVFALFKLGAVPVLIDPGMGKRNLLKAIQDVRPEAMVAETIVHVLRQFHRHAFAEVKVAWRVSKLLGGIEAEEKEFALFEAKPETLAAILFTSGGTGSPKGVLYTHGILTAQTHMLREMFGLQPEHVDMPGFPLFALFTLAMGMTSVVPDMDPTCPAACDPAKLVRTIFEQQVSFVAGSPAIWHKVARYCVEKKLQLPSLKYVVMFGAPVSGEIHALWSRVLPFGKSYAPYGATECLPVASMDGPTMLRETWPLTLQGAGICVGEATPGNQIFIIPISDTPSALAPLPSGEIGEIVVTGPTVTPGYFDNVKATALAKIESSGRLYHRMGDVGWLDTQGRLWFCGRKSHRVGALYPIQVEAIFNQHPDVIRSALVDLATMPAVVVESTRVMDRSFVQELKALGLQHTHTQGLERFFTHGAFPVDVRHNIKIDRLALSVWAREQA